MRIVILALLLPLACAQAAYSQSQTRAGKLGAGFMVGNPIGANVKYWVNSTQALDAGLGFSGDLAFFADYLWHGWKAFPQPREGELAARVGLGVRVEDDEFGFRAMPGLDYWLPRHPIEIFVELGPVFRVTPGTSVSLDGALGVRYYFNRFN